MDPVIALTILGITPAGKEVAKEGVKVVADFARQVFGPTLDAAGRGITAPVAAWADRRQERAKQLVIDAAVTVEEAGQKALPVPGRVLMLLLLHGSVDQLVNG